MNKKQIFSEVLTIIKPYVKNEDTLKSAVDSTRFIGDLKINSARLVDIIIDFEDKFEVTISDDEAELIQTVGDAVALIEKLLKHSK